jgi:hypothetical protein
MLLRRDAALAVGGYDDSFRGMYEDQVFVTKLALRFPVLTSGRCWDWYRQHPASACGVAAAEGRASVERARLAFLDWVASWLEREGAQDEELRHELSRQLWLYRHWRREPADERAQARALRRRWAKKWVLRAERALAPRAVRRLLWRPRPSSGR